MRLETIGHAGIAKKEVRSQNTENRIRCLPLVQSKILNLQNDMRCKCLRYASSSVFCLLTPVFSVSTPFDAKKIFPRENQTLLL